jgi:amino-acid N-acetyltransferase
MTGIRRAGPADMDAVRDLIVSEGMPAVELERWLENFWVIDSGDAVAGCAGVEIYGEAAVLRSVAVAPSLRGAGWGVRLVRRCLDFARELGAKRCYLFTMTAADFFPRFGFQACSLDDFEPTVRESWQHRANMDHEALRRMLTPMKAAL